MFSWLKLLGFEESIIQLRTIFKNTQPSEFIIYNLPNGLWVISSTIFLLIIWENNYNKEFGFYFSLLLLMVILPELLQYFNIISGTFDITDLIVNFFGLVIPVFFILILSKKWF
jgi:glycopeptide antibiotics resistance protein|tara:strand:- start:101 stop:442 length:342 start_codon:yes stop_codon:yes gene_type:complete